MDMQKIIIARPQDWIDRAKSNTATIWFHDVEALYDSIPEVCEEMGIPYQVKNLTAHVVQKKPGCIYLGHHTYGKTKNMWHLKKGYVPGYMYWDKTGYSGWSEAVERYDKEQFYDFKDIAKTSKILEEYISSNSSKIKQPDTAEIPDHKYVLVLGQRPHDTVSRHAYINTTELSRFVNEAYKDSDIKVYTKPHPMSLKTSFAGKAIEGSMHHLIAAAEAVYTVNSGSGFEALFHDKKVYTSGACDYSPATIVVKNFQDIKNTIHAEKPHTSEIMLYLHYCLNDHFVNCYDKESIKRKLQRCVDEYEI